MYKNIFRGFTLSIILILLLGFSIISHAQEDLKILSINSLYSASGDYIHVVGEIENQGNKAYSFVTLGITFYDSNDQIVDTTTAIISYILPGQKRPFKSMSPKHSEIKKYKVYIENMYELNEKKYDNQIKILSNRSFKSSSGDYMHVVGEVRNDSPMSFKFLTVEVTFYDKKGKVVDTTSAIIQNLSTGATKPFKTMSQYLSNVDKYLVQVSQ